MNLPVLFKQEVEKPDPTWLHIAGLHTEEDGSGGVVWLEHDNAHKNSSGKIILYDSWSFSPGTHFALISDAIKKRGDGRVPIAWEAANEAFVKSLKDRGCKMMGEGYVETPEICAASIREISEKMSSGLFSVLDTNIAWLSEYTAFLPKDGLIQQKGFPILSSTRHAFHCLRRAKQVVQIKRKARPANHWGGSIA